MKQIDKFQKENPGNIISVRHLCMFAAMNWAKKSTMNPKPEDLSVPPALWKLLNDNIKQSIIVLQKMYSNDKRNTNTDQKETIDAKKKQFDRNLKTSSSKKKTEARTKSKEKAKNKRKRKLKTTHNFSSVLFTASAQL